MQKTQQLNRLQDRTETFRNFCFQRVKIVEMKILLSLIFLNLLPRSIANNQFFDTVPVRTPEVFPIFFSIIDLLEDISQIFGTEHEILNLVDNIDKNIEIIPAVQVICKTVGGPNPGRDCVFPFKWNDKVHNGCPIDPNDKRSVLVSTD